MIYRIRDILMAIVLIIILSPIVAFAAILIKLFMPGPIFFIQDRIGQRGQRFKIFKLRSMIVNTSNHGITLRKDERITRLGYLLRKTKIDEFPQLWNILKGEMSFVGPRPDLPGYYDTLEGSYRKILELKPGLTGFDSMVYPYEEKLIHNLSDPMKYYKEVLWPHKVRLNFWYYNNRSFVLDFKIMINTLTQIMCRKSIFRFPTIE